MRVWLLILALAVMPIKAVAQDREVLLHAPRALVETGLMDYILPRFSLKNRVPVTLVEDPAAAQMLLGAEGRPLFEGAGQVWAMQVVARTEWTDRLSDWLTSEVGRNTVLAYAPDGEAPFRLPERRERDVAEVALDGDPALGLKVARAKCTRCHAVDDETVWSGIGSTPSFAVLRSLPDWEARFTAFYALNPHPAFMQIEDVSAPFHESRPSPIVPIEMTLEEVEAVLAYVAVMEAADLGAPLARQ